MPFPASAEPHGLEPKVAVSEVVLADTEADVGSEASAGACGFRREI